MLPDQDRQLLTAYVDGELSSRQRRHVERLLRRSGEARELYRKLRHDAHALRGLPRPHLPADLSDPVLKAIRTRRLTPRRPRRPPPVFSVWAAAAAAAAVLLAVGLGSYLYFADPRAPELPVAEVPNPPAPAPEDKRPDGGDRPDEKDPTPPIEPAPGETPPEPDLPGEVLPPVRKVPPKAPDKPEPKGPLFY